MKTRRHHLLALGLWVALGTAARAQPAPQELPDGPFKTVHLMLVSPAQEPALLAAVRDYNRAFAEQGCSACAYHIFRMFTGTREKYNYMMTSDWPSRDAYAAIHASPAYGDASKRNPVMNDLYQDEFYGRYVEVR